MIKKYRCQFRDKEQTWDMDHDEAKEYVRTHPGWHIVLIPEDERPLYSAIHPRPPFFQRVWSSIKAFFCPPRFSPGALENAEQSDEFTRGRLSVLKDFDVLCKADAFMGFDEIEWKAVQKFFRINKEISGWDK